MTKVTSLSPPMIKDTLPEEYYWFYNPYENEYGISKMDGDFWNSPFC